MRYSNELETEILNAKDDILEKSTKDGMQVEINQWILWIEEKINQKNKFLSMIENEQT